MNRLLDPYVAASLVWLGFLAVSLPFLAQADLRPAIDLRAARSIVVSSERDSGPGSLREAIFESARSDSRVRVILLAPRVVLASPLPGLVSPHGVFIDAKASHTEIDASAVLDAPALDLVGPDVTVEGVTIRGAAGHGVLVRGAGAHLVGVRAVDCGNGIFMLDEASNVVVEDSTLDYNGVGVRVPSRPRGIVVRGSRFRGNDQAGLWGVSATSLGRGSSQELIVRSNSFTLDRMGVVLINVPGLIEGNEFDDEAEAAIHVSGLVEVRENHIRGGGYGIFAFGLDGAVFESNDISRSGSVGLLLREASGTVARNNRVDANLYGIVTLFGSSAGALVTDNLIINQQSDGVFVIGGSPIVRGNRILGNHGVGLRVFDFISSDGDRSAARPTLSGNTVSGNHDDQPVKGTYREPVRSQKP